ncbi:MAG: Pr6Pr family membrane protein [Clostridia bacterium]|nr:Pr6Pr family membrane protein [Clostridia bacterium]
MIKNRTTQLIFYTVYCTLGLVGCIACLGIFDDIDMIRWDFYVYFTNISNFLCLGIMVASLINTIKRKEDGFNNTIPMLKFIGMLGILLTFLVFNIMLAGAEGRDPQLNWRIGSLTFHVVLPILYIADWFLFYERKQCKWYYPIASVSFPLAYAIFLLIHAAILNFDSSILTPTGTGILIYPYFFVNLETPGVPGVLMWIGILAVAFIAIGFLFYGLDRLKYKKQRESEN